jgi:hypothetical protein
MFIYLIIAVALGVLIYTGIIDIPIYVPIAIALFPLIWPMIQGSLGGFAFWKDQAGVAVNAFGCTGLVLIRDRGPIPRWAHKDRIFPVTAERAASMIEQSRQRYIPDGCL